MRIRTVYVDQGRRFSLDIDEGTGRSFVSIPVRNSLVEYDEWYEVDDETFESFQADPTLAHEFVARAKRREIDHLLLLQPGSDRGEPD